MLGNLNGSHLSTPIILHGRQWFSPNKITDCPKFFLRIFLRVLHMGLFMHHWYTIRQAAETEVTEFPYFLKQLVSVDSITPKYNRKSKKCYLLTKKPLVEEIIALRILFVIFSYKHLLSYIICVLQVTFKSLSYKQNRESTEGYSKSIVR